MKNRLGRLLITGLAVCVLAPGCQSDAPKQAAASVRPSTPAEAGVSVLQQLEALGPELWPLLERRYEGQQFMRFYVNRPVAPTPAAQADTLRALLRQQPDAANLTAAVFLDYMQGPVIRWTPAPELERVLQRHPESDVAWYLLAGLQSRRRDRAAARASVDEAIRRNDQVGAYYSLRAGLHDDNAAAIRDYERALTLFKDKRGLYQALAQIYVEGDQQAQYLRAKDSVIADMRREMVAAQRQGQSGVADQHYLQERMGNEHLEKAIYLTRWRRGREACPDLRLAKRYGVPEADTMIARYCR
ncbi:hypothetical protein EJV47_18285 [Hymenobacter gummosus]|uniref:Tetratricopeptide repeat protein n=1 Tax=Hymenobacter gummosus TaxID=1776032 RepID=A0A3S0ILR2_9BACT|nr:hypothetical protein [Hymenobacter gummosus]RTQ47868.1 hypothetical protein EJV47_18285 [Hymenobacter gummosus]